MTTSHPNDLARWLEGEEDGLNLDADVRETIYVFRPGLAPSPQVPFDVIIDDLKGGPFSASPTEDVDPVDALRGWIAAPTAPAPAVGIEDIFQSLERGPLAAVDTTPELDDTSNVIPLFRRWSPVVGGLLAAACALIVLLPTDYETPNEPTPFQIAGEAQQQESPSTPSALPTDPAPKVNSVMKDEVGVPPMADSDATDSLLLAVEKTTSKPSSAISGSTAVLAEPAPPSTPKKSVFGKEDFPGNSLLDSTSFSTGSVSSSFGGSSAGKQNEYGVGGLGSKRAGARVLSKEEEGGMLQQPASQERILEAAPPSDCNKCLGSCFRTKFTRQNGAAFPGGSNGNPANGGIRIRIFRFKTEYASSTKNGTK